MEFRRDGGRGVKLWRALDKTTTWTERRMEFRGSSLPFCPRAYFLDKVLQPASERSFAEEVRLWRGHGIHNCLQHWLGQTGLLFGDWECSVCRAIPNVVPYVVKDRRGPPGVCPTHGATLRYKEYDLSYEGLSGHPDGLTVDGPNSFCLLEAKSLQHRAARYSSYPDWMSIKEPMPHHVEQANAYACMVPRVKGLKITKVLVWYISIDRPTWKPKIFEFEPDEARFQRHLDTLKQIEAQDLDGLPPSCPKGHHDPFCPFSDAGYCSMSPRKLKLILEEHSR